METNEARRLEQAVATLNDLIDLARHCGLDESAQFLAMAKMHLLMDLNGVTDAEFRALCAVLEGKTEHRGGARARPGQTRARRDGELRVMRRAWQCPEGVAAPRGGRTGTKS